jgi:hypothetical protein
MSNIETINKINLSLNRISVNDEYKKEWHIIENDFMLLCNNDKPISETLYRIGGINNPNPKKDKYFMLIKYTEAYYDDKILKHCKDKDPKHLEGRWCIIDSNGVEKVVFDAFKHGYIVKDSCIYHIDSKYYNIETGEYYGRATSSVESSKKLYLDLKYNDNPNKRGLLIINKQTGFSELEI